jgi:hypothetical protein
VPGLRNGKSIWNLIEEVGPDFQRGIVLTAEPITYGTCTDGIRVCEHSCSSFPTRGF